MLASMKKISANSIYTTYAVLGLSAMAFCIQTLYSGHFEDFSYLIIVILALSSVFLLSTFFFFVYKKIIIPCLELSDSKETFLQTLQIPHYDPNPIMQFSLEGELLFANISAHKHMQLDQGKYTNNAFTQAVRAEIKGLTEHGPVVKKELNYNNHSFLTHMTAVYGGENTYINVYAIDITELNEKKDS